MPQEVSVAESHRRVVFLLALALSASCAAKPLDRPMRTGPVATGPGTLAEARAYLNGRWTLVSMDLFPPGQPPIHAGATGTLVYDEYANLEIALRFDADTTRAADLLGIPVPDGMLTTTGRTIIDVNTKSITYLLEGQAPNRAPAHPLDTARPRYWEVDGNTLTLRTKDAAGNVLSVTVWRKGA